MTNIPAEWWKAGQNGRLRPLGFIRKRSPITRQMELVPDPLEICILRLIRLLRAGGTSFSQIAERVTACLRNRNYFRSQHKGREQKGSPHRRNWTTSLVTRAIAEQQYAEDVLAYVRGFTTASASTHDDSAASEPQ